MIYISKEYGFSEIGQLKMETDILNRKLISEFNSQNTNDELIKFLLSKYNNFIMNDTETINTATKVRIIRGLEALRSKDLVKSYFGRIDKKHFKYLSLTKEQWSELINTEISNKENWRKNLDEVNSIYKNAMESIKFLRSEYYENNIELEQIKPGYLYRSKYTIRINNNEDDRFCEACQNSPCVCSDSRTSTISDYNITN